MNIARVPRHALLHIGVDSRLFFTPPFCLRHIEQPAAHTEYNRRVVRHAAMLARPFPPLSVGQAARNKTPAPTLSFVQHASIARRLPRHCRPVICSSRSVMLWRTQALSPMPPARATRQRLPIFAVIDTSRRCYAHAIRPEEQHPASVQQAPPTPRRTPARLPSSSFIILPTPALFRYRCFSPEGSLPPIHRKQTTAHVPLHAFFRC